MIVEVFESVSKIAAAEWNSVVASDSIICRHEYLLSVERSKINDCRYFYPVVRDNDGTIIAHTCLYFISTELDLFATSIVKKFTNVVRKMWPGFLIMRSLECGTPVALGNTISFKKNINKENALKLLVRATEDMSRKIGVKDILFRDFYSHNVYFFDALKCLGYARIHNLPTTMMAVKWHSFDEYVASMRSQYRYRFRKRQRKFAEMGGEIYVISEFGCYADKLAWLWQNTYDRAREYRREILKKDFFENLDRHLGTKSAVILAKAKGEVVGFCSLMCDDTVLHWGFCGLDYDVNEDAQVYYNMMYRVVRYAIEGGFKHIDLGMTTLDGKMDIGAKVETQLMYMKHTGLLLNKVIPFLFEKMTPQPSILARNVFKRNGEEDREDMKKR
jgi:predicted N-acyltransferase